MDEAAGQGPSDSPALPGQLLPSPGHCSRAQRSGVQSRRRQPHLRGHGPAPGCDQALARASAGSPPPGFVTPGRRWEGSGCPLLPQGVLASGEGSMEGERSALRFTETRMNERVLGAGTAAPRGQAQAGPPPRTSTPPRPPAGAWAKPAAEAACARPPPRAHARTRGGVHTALSADSAGPAQHSGPAPGTQDRAAAFPPWSGSRANPARPHDSRRH